MNREEGLCFRVDGDAITSLARTLWADEGAPEKAFRILLAAFPDMSRGDQLSILSGEKKLVGDEHGMDLEDDGATVSEHGNSLYPEVIFRKLQEKLKAEERLCMSACRLLGDDTVVVGSPEGKRVIPRPERESRSKPVVRDEITGTSGWLTPEGKFYPCAWMEHIRTVDALGFDERQVEKLGWIKIESTNGAIAPEKEPTQAQINAIWDWCQREGRECPYWMRSNNEDQ